MKVMVIVKTPKSIPTDIVFFAFTYNLGQNTWIIFHILAQFPLPKCETKLDYYHQRVSL